MTELLGWFDVVFGSGKCHWENCSRLVDMGTGVGEREVDIRSWMLDCRWIRAVCLRV